MKRNNLDKLNPSTRWMIRKELEYLKKAFERKDYGYASFKANILNGIIIALVYQRVINHYTYFLLSGVITSIELDGKINISRVKKYIKLV